MKLTEIPDDMRRARTAALKYVGYKLKEKKYSKRIKRLVLLQTDLDIIFRIMEKLDEISGFSPGCTLD